ncbi:unnamed protein product [Heligmosomoides polygyrus]|uniref:Secreted protein n=1 Tax=Heligmosomoides polygyrus TaxID=6339 RepID=A0A183GA99_HELPZ|nr:unnamed protein product [Heligmosomoides polygyrus]
MLDCQCKPSEPPIPLSTVITPNLVGLQALVVGWVSIASAARAVWPTRELSERESADRQLDSSCPLCCIPDGTCGWTRPTMTDEREERARGSGQGKKPKKNKNPDRQSDPLLSADKWAELGD